MNLEELEAIYDQADRAYEQAFERREAGDRIGAIRPARESVECWRKLVAAGTEENEALAGLARALNMEAVVLGEGGLREEALASAREAALIRRDLANAQPEAYAPDLAMSLMTLASALSALGRPEEALDLAHMSVDLQRTLAQTQPQVFQGKLAHSLNNLAALFSQLGRRDEALDPLSEAVRIYRATAQAQPQEYLPDLALSLTNLAGVFGELGRSEEALAVAREAVEIQRGLVADQPQAFLPALALSLNGLAIRLGDLGRREEALVAIEESVGSYRALAKAMPEVYMPDLAMCLSNLSKFLSELGRREEALVPAEEAIRIWRDLAKIHPQAFRPNLAKSLIGLAARLSELGRREEALAPAEEAVGIYRTLAQAQPQAFLPDLASSLNNLAVFFNELGRNDEALLPAEEAVAVRRALAEAQPQAFLPDLALSLATLANILRNLGRRESALVPGEEAVGIRRALATARPQVFLPELAMSLNNLGIFLGDLGRREEALVPAEEAIGIWRALARDDPRAFLPALAQSLNNLASVLSNLDRHEEAIVPAEEGVGIQRALAKALPSAFRPGLAMLIQNFASLLGDLGRCEEALALGKESVRLRRALAKAQPRAFGPGLAKSLTNLTDQLIELGRRKEALTSLNEALVIYQRLPPSTQRALADDRALALWKLARIHRSTTAPSLRDLPKAFDALRDAVHCIEEYRGTFRDEAQRRRVISETIPIYETMIHTAIELWESSQDPAALREALWAAEGVRQRQLLDRLRAEVLEPDAPEEVRQEWRDWFEQLEAAERALDSFERDGTDSHSPGLPGAGPSSTVDSPFSRSSAAPDTRETLREALTARRDKMEARHKQVLERVHRFDPDFDPYQPLPRAGLDDARRLLDTRPGTVLVEYVVTESSGYALLVHGERVHPVQLPTLTTGEVQAMGTKWLEGYGHGKLESWGLGLRAKLAELAPQVLWPVLEALRKLSAREGFQPEGLILCLHQYLNLLPFHAMPVDPGGDELLIDRFEVSYAPSLSMLKHGARRRPGGGKTCLIGDPKGDLRFIELVTLAYRRAHPEAEVIHGEDGTVGAFLQRGGQMQRAEIWAHMGAAEDPMDAGIQFAQGEVLRLHQIYRELRLRLRPHLVLNGCESGLMSPVRRPGTERKGKDSGEVYLTDFDGLPMGFLFAGARSVVSTLWTVYDLSAALLMDRYHQELRGENATPAGALRRASQWLRKEIRNGEDLREVGEDLLSRVPAEWAWENPDRIEHCRRVLAERAEEHQEDPPFAEPLHWASHYVTGWSWGAVVEGEDVGGPGNTIACPR